MIYIARDRTGAPCEVFVGRALPLHTQQAWMADGYTWAAETAEACTEAKPELRLFQRPPATPPAGRAS